MRKQDGYTLVETLVTVFIIGLLSVLAVPRLSDTIVSVQHYNAARQLLADAQLVRQKSITEQVSWKIEFFPNNGFYRVIRDTTEVSEMRRYLPEHITYTHNSSSGFWIFNKLGEATNSFSTVTVMAPNGKRLYVILAISGRLRISTTPPGG